MSDKIKPQHLARKAIVYVRQSSAHQVHHNLESQRLQYAMQDRLQQLGWREIDVVDDDLGRNTRRSPANHRFFRPFTHIARWGSMKRRCSTPRRRRAVGANEARRTR